MACKEEAPKTKATKVPVKPPPKKQPDPAAKVIAACWKGDDAAMAQCYAKNAELQVLDGFSGGKVRGAAAIAKHYKTWRTGFPDLSSKPQLIMANGRKVVTVVLSTGTHKGEFMSIPATDKKLSVLWAQVLELDKEGKIWTERRYIDQGTLLVQLGGLEGDGVPTAETPWAKALTIDAEPSASAKTINTKAIKDGLDHLNTKSAKKLAAGFTENTRFRYVPEKKMVEGRAAVDARFTEYFGVNEKLRTEARDSWLAGGWGMLETVATGETTKKFRAATKTKKGNWRVSYLEIFEFDDKGLIQNEWVFVNGLKFAADIGLFDPGQLNE